MSKEMTIIALGVWVIVVPYLGVPMGWRTVILALSGIALMTLGFLLRSEALGRSPEEKPQRQERSFVEHIPQTHAEMTPLAETHEQKEGITSLN